MSVLVVGDHFILLDSFGFLPGPKPTVNNILGITDEISYPPKYTPAFGGTLTEKAYAFTPEDILNFFSYHSEDGNEIRITTQLNGETMVFSPVGFFAYCERADVVEALINDGFDPEAPSYRITKDGTKITSKCLMQPIYCLLDKNLNISTLPEREADIISIITTLSHDGANLNRKAEEMTAREDRTPATALDVFIQSHIIFDLAQKQEGSEEAYDMVENTGVLIRAGYVKLNFFDLDHLRAVKNIIEHACKHGALIDMMCSRRNQMIATAILELEISEEAKLPETNSWKALVQEQRQNEWELRH